MVDVTLDTIRTVEATRRRRYSLTLDEVAALRDRGNVIPVYREIMADMETPVSAYLKIADGPHSFLLESVEGGQTLARYSFLGSNPYLIVRLERGVAYANQRGYKQEISYDDPLVALQSFLAPYRAVHVEGLPRFLGGAVGYLSYEAVRYFEDLPAAPNDPNLFPDGVFMFVDTMLVFDHLERRIKVVSHVHVDDGMPLERAYSEAIDKIEALVARLQSTRPESPVTERTMDPAAVHERALHNMDREYYDEMIERAKEYIRAGDIFQVVLSQRVEVETGAHPFTLYRALRTVNPSPFMFYLQLGDEQIVGASPEALIRLDGRELTTHPIAGTRRRGRNEEEDLALEAELLADEKERAEHVMLVDLARNDIGRVAQPGSVRVPVLLRTDRFSHVIHLVSHVTGEIRDGLSAVDALRACFPAGTVSGAPKIRAMEIIAELERDRRGFYAGCVGYVAYSGNMDMALALRTVAMRDGKVYMQAGGGIVYDSTADYEYQETLNKMGAAMRALEVAEQLELDERAARSLSMTVNGVER
ncbi:MAG TPA: anthranilate synthase component I [Thermomicrobiales bacterium]|nr:anthranilate synthase component I [Thermomicrobiales bacterium]